MQQDGMQRCIKTDIRWSWLSPETSDIFCPSSVKNEYATMLIGITDSTSIGWKQWVLSKAEYFSTLRTAASSTVKLASVAEASTYESARSKQQSFHGIMVRPSGRFLSDQVSPWGSLVTERSVEPTSHEQLSCWMCGAWLFCLELFYICSICINQGSTVHTCTDTNSNRLVVRSQVTRTYCHH